LFFSKKEKPPQKDKKDPEPYPLVFRSTWGTPERKKRGFVREDISPPYSALEEPKTTKSASEEEKTKHVYIIYLIGKTRRTASIKENLVFKCPKENTLVPYTLRGKFRIADKVFNELNIG